MRKHGTKYISRSGWWYWLAGLALIIIDQAAKYWASSALSRRPLDLGFVAFDYATNTGSSFSMFQGANSILIWVSVLVIGGLIYWYDAMVEGTSLWQKISYTLIVAGILGNLVDRVAWGSVIDFIDLRWWPIFNVADSCLVVGVVIYVISELAHDRNNSNGLVSKGLRGKKRK